jgi:hypothetical protein
LNVYKKEEEKLYNLPLSKLEYGYRRFKVQSHPHGEFGSIHSIFAPISAMIIAAVLDLHVSINYICKC